MECNKQEQFLKISSDKYWYGVGSQQNDRITKLKACLLDEKGWSWNKSYDAQEYVRRATANLHEHYEGAGEVNKRVVWATENIENAHSMSKHTYSFEKFSTVLQDDFTILNNNGKKHS